jgi:hypothetical protein
MSSDKASIVVIAIIVFVAFVLAIIQTNFSLNPTMDPLLLINLPGIMISAPVLLVIGAITFFLFLVIYRKQLPAFSRMQKIALFFISGMIVASVVMIGVFLDKIVNAPANPVASNDASTQPAQQQ